MTLSLAPLTSSAQTDAAPAPERAPASEERNEFLRLLTAQIQNQDPLEPLDANQFIEQLATINNLEQQITSNRHLEEIVGLLRKNAG
ncbi:MAG: flagellar hook capping FlgD N-terminal domain-containing protein [Parvularcula sp.]|jgi:flagellar basal-body rod modification protein FlgD|nr:flagellar hook capping FlgD N-terminal domain-containing protein [Parvularcula sp.]